VSNFRIKESNGTFVVQVQKQTNFLLFRRKYWTHYISVSGIDSLPWHHSTFDFAMMNLIKKVEEETIINSRKK